MLTRNSSSSPCGEPESLKHNLNILKFSKLMMNEEPLTAAAQGPPIVTFDTVPLSLPNSLAAAQMSSPRKSQFEFAFGRSVTAQPLPRNTINASNMPLATMLAGGAGSLIIDPANPLRKSSSRGLTAMLARRPSPGALPARSHLFEALRSFDAKNTANNAYNATREDSDEECVEVADVATAPEEASKPPSVRMGTSSSDLSTDSAPMESGYKSVNTTTTQRLPQEVNAQAEGGVVALSRCYPELCSRIPPQPAASVVEECAYRPAVTDAACLTVPASEADDSTDQISQLIVDLIGPSSRIGKLILDSCAYASQDTDGIYDEIRQRVHAELRTEDKLGAFFKQRGLEAAAYDPHHLDDTLTFVKEHLTLIRGDLSEFKESCAMMIDSKVSRTEFADATSILNVKMTYLERKLFNEHQLMRQHIRSLREKFEHLEGQSLCGLKNFPLWPFITFLGAYSIVKLVRS